MAFMALGDIRNLLNLRSWSWSRAIPWQIRGRAQYCRAPDPSRTVLLGSKKKLKKVSPRRGLWNLIPTWLKNSHTLIQHWVFPNRKDDIITLQQHFNIVRFQAWWQIVMRTNWGRRWHVLLNRFVVFFLFKLYFFLLWCVIPGQHWWLFYFWIFSCLRCIRPKYIRFLTSR